MVNDVNPYLPPKVDLAPKGLGMLAAEPLRVGSAIGKSLRLYGRYFSKLAPLVVLIYAPIELVKNYVLYTMPIEEMTAMRVEMFITSVVASFLAPAVLFVIVESERTQRPVRLTAAYAYGATRWGHTFIARLIAGLVMGLAFLLFVIPGIIVMVWYFLTDEVVALERDNTGAKALSRSKKISEGRRFGVFGIFVLAFLIYLPALAGANAIYYFVDSWLVATLADFLMDLAAPFFSIVGLVVYVSLVFGSEGGTDWMKRMPWVPVAEQGEPEVSNE